MSLPHCAKDWMFSHACISHAYIARACHMHSHMAMGFRYGEFLLVTCPSGVRRLFKLHSDGVYRGRGRPNVTHEELVAKGSSYVTINKDVFRRPTLEEYVVLMDRVPAPTYPKDAQAMIAMLDIAGGCVVMEAGAGSGGLALHLSRSGEYDVRGMVNFRSGGYLIYKICIMQGVWSYQDAKYTKVIGKRIQLW